jgi:hypothetical protein
VKELLMSAVDCTCCQTEVYTVESFSPDRSPFEVEIAIAKFKKCESPGIEQILAELIEAGGETLQSEIHKLILLE